MKKAALLNKRVAYEFAKIIVLKLLWETLGWQSCGRLWWS